MHNEKTELKNQNLKMLQKPETCLATMGQIVCYTLDFQRVSLSSSEGPNRHEYEVLPHWLKN